MGNSQSAEKASDCPPLCRALCWGKPPSKVDDGEWFGELPRDKTKRKGKKSSRSSRNLSKMPPVPEEHESVGSDTVLTTDESGAGLSTTGDEKSVDAQSSPGGASSSSSPLFSSDSPKSLPPKATLAPTSSPLELQRRASDSNTKVDKKKNNKPNRQPKDKLTFVNGQFVNLSTKRGKELVEEAASAAAGGGATGAVGIGGIVSSVQSGHGGILGPPGPSPSPSEGGNSNGVGKRRKSLTSMYRNQKSDGSAASASSHESSAASTQGSNGSGGGGGRADSKDAVTSIAALGDGSFLTGSRSDRIVKMWKVEKNVAGKPSVRFVRDFAGHSTGITSLARVDDKGRFLSASKDRMIKLWDSRFNCADDEEDDGEEHRYLLASFENMDRRNIHGIAIVDDGSYVRPTDNVDMAMATAATLKAMKEGSAALAKAAKERQIIACSCEFATISGRHNVVKLWSVNLLELEVGQHPSQMPNVAEAKAGQELKHDAVVESIEAVRGKGLILTGDRMGHVRLWNSAKNVFLPNSSRAWSCVRTFSWRPKSKLSTVDESMLFAITSLAFLQGNTMFVSGSKSGNLRVWKVDGTKTKGETVNKELICITGAHNMAITSVRQGPGVKDDGDNNNNADGNLSFSSASEDGKVLSFAVPVAKVGSCNPSCFNVVNHGIANRYVVGAEPVGVTALACLRPEKARDILVTGSTVNGSVNLLKRAGAPKQGPQGDALLRYRQAMEEESLMLYAVADELCNGGGVESRNRKLNLMTHKDVFTGKDVVSYLVDNEYAASRMDAVDLGRVLATHLSLFECKTKKGKLLEDDAKTYYRWSGEYSKSKNADRVTQSLTMRQTT